MKFILSVILVACLYFSGVAQNVVSTTASKPGLNRPSEITQKPSQQVKVPPFRTCYTDEHTKNIQEKNEHYLSDQEFEKRIQDQIIRARAFRATEDVLRIPVIVHVVHNGEPVGMGSNISQSQVQSQIDVLNEDFRRVGAGANTHASGADINIEFVLAVLGPDGEELTEPGIHRVNGGEEDWDYSDIETTLKRDTYWDPTKYFNIWTLKFSDEEELLGYAQFPNFSDLDGLEKSNGIAETDGVVIGYNFFGRTGNVSYPYDKGRTATHEVGHWLGLRHVWGDGDCSTDDFCADTPNAGQPNYTCQQINTCNDGDTDANDMIENYMDYTTDACMNIFTINQKERMRAVLAKSPRRKELVQSTVGEATDKPVANFEMTSTSGCAEHTINFIDKSTNNPTTWTWNFYAGGQFLAEFHGQEVSIKFSGTGVYSVELVVENDAGETTLYKENVITIYSDQGVNSLEEDIENVLENDFFANWVIVNPDADRGWQYSEISAFDEGAYSLRFDNYSGDTDPTGNSDALVTPPIDLTSSGVPYLKFDHAYAIYGEGYEDALSVLFSLDCGVSWNTLWAKAGDDLATSAPTEDPFFPTAGQWQSNEISLAGLSGHSTVHFAFVNTSGWGNLLYLDNIEFGQIEISQAAEADFSAERTKICENEVIQFNDASLNTPSTWEWHFTGAVPETSDIQNPEVQYNGPGFYDVTLSASNSLGGSIVSKSDYIEVVPLPELTITGPATACEGDEITLTAEGGENIKWLSRGSVIFEGNSYVFIIQEDIDLQISGENELGCKSTSNYSISVISSPELEILSDKEGYCEPGEITITAVGGASYEWLNNNTNLGAGSSLTTTIDETTTFTLIGYTEDGSCSSEASLTVELYETTIPQITKSSNTLICTEAVLYQWFLNDEEIPTANERFLTPLEEGAYTVKTTDANGCEMLSQAFIYEVTAVDDLYFNEIALYPNPVRSVLNIEGISGEGFVNIFDASGRVILSQRVESKNNSAQIDVNDFEKGLYMLDVTDQNGVRTKKKFIKE